MTKSTSYLDDVILQKRRFERWLVRLVNEILQVHPEFADYEFDHFEYRKAIRDGRNTIELYLLSNNGWDFKYQMKAGDRMAFIEINGAIGGSWFSALNPKMLEPGIVRVFLEAASEFAT